MRILILVLVANTAYAEPAKEQAARLFEEGKELAKLAKYRDACDRFATSYELEPALGTQLNFADCQEHLGNLSRAYALFDDVANRTDRKTNAVRAQYARDRANALAPRLATVVLKIADTRRDRITVTIAGRKITPAAEIHERVDPGDVEIVVTAPERRFAQTAHTTSGKTEVIEVPVLGASETRRRRRWVLAAAGMGAAGAVAMSVSGVMGLYAARHYHTAFARGECFETPDGDRCTPEGRAIVDAARSRANLATGVFIGGAALAGTAIAVYLLAPRETGVEVKPAVTATSVGLVIGRAF